MGNALFQQEYKIIKKAFEEKLHKEDIIQLLHIQNEITRLYVSPNVVVEGMAKNYVNYSAVFDRKFLESFANVSDPKKLSGAKNNLIIFDDLQLEEQDKCETYYL